MICDELEVKQAFDSMLISLECCRLCWCMMLVGVFAD